MELQKSVETKTQPPQKQVRNKIDKRDRRKDGRPKSASKETQPKGKKDVKPRYLEKVPFKHVFGSFFIFDMSSCRKPEIQNDLPKITNIT